jgi:flagellar hook-associated protein 2
MVNMSVDGLVSGLDTTSLITQLMQAEAAPQNALKTKLSQTQIAQNAYRSINARYSALQTAADALATGAAWAAPTASVSTLSGDTGGVTATSAATGSSGTVTFDVTSVARPHSIATGSFTDISQLSATWPATLSGTKNGVAYSISLPDQTLSGVVSAINSAKDANGAALGLVATAIQVTPGTYRLQVSAKDSGAANQFTMTGFGATTVVQTGTDAQLDLGGGLTVNSSTNTFTDLLPGTPITVSRPATGVTVAASVSADALADKVQAMVTAANNALSEASTQTAYNVTAKSGGPLVGDSTVRGLQSTTSNAVTSAVGGVSPTVAGLAVDRNGTITFDRSAFLVLMSSDPTKAQAVVSGVASGLSAVAKGASDTTTGSLTLAAQSADSAIKDLNDRISDWDTRLATRKTALQQQFTAMETALSNLKNQSSWLSSQISSLSSTSG